MGGGLCLGKSSRRVMVFVTVMLEAADISESTDMLSSSIEAAELKETWEIEVCMMVDILDRAWVVGRLEEERDGGMPW